MFDEIQKSLILKVTRFGILNFLMKIFISLRIENFVNFCPRIAKMNSLFSKWVLLKMTGVLERHSTETVGC